MKVVIHSDGGARGNPGPAGIGAVIEFLETQKIIEVSEKIGETTNNVAEYKAILKALQVALANGASEAECFLDSELVVRQLNGEYRIKDPKLAYLANEIIKEKKNYAAVSFTSIAREQNKKADKLVNKALDQA